MAEVVGRKIILYFQHVTFSERIDEILHNINESIITTI